MRRRGTRRGLYFCSIIPVNSIVVGSLPVVSNAVLSYLKLVLSSCLANNRIIP